jgi:hypothetical protein
LASAARSFVSAMVAAFNERKFPPSGTHFASAELNVSTRHGVDIAISPIEARLLGEFIAGGGADVESPRHYRARIADIAAKGAK